MHENYSGRDINKTVLRNESSVVREYLDFLNGLRCITVLLVIAFHLELPVLTGGFVGVDVFFVISGFLITGICADNTFSLSKFYQSRILRIYPAYVAMLFMTIFLGSFLLLPADLVDLARTEIYSIFFLQNFPFWHSINYFEMGQDNSLLHTWSLAVEWQVYAVLPFFMIITKRFRYMLVVAS